MNATAVLERPDYQVIAGWIRPGERVLDLGCGDGSLLRYLVETRGARGYGVEKNPVKVLASVENGINVIQSDLEAGLSGFRDGAFDHVILSLTLQAMHRTENLVSEMLRVAREAIVTFPNFAYWKHRVQIALGGRMPVSQDLPYQWYDTPNIHLCTVEDFDVFCRDRRFTIIERRVLHDGRPVGFLPNLRGSIAVFRFTRSS
jgi:methionine biosynthesis protein MetW